MRVLNGNILIKDLAVNGDTTPEGIILPQTRELRYEIGVVLDTGEGTPLGDGTFRAPRVAVGNLIAFHTGGGVPMTMQGQPCRFLPESNVIAVLKEDVLEVVPADGEKH